MSQNESGDEEDISGDEFDENDEAYVGESESSDQDSSHSSEEEPEDNNPDGSESDNATAGPPLVEPDSMYCLCKPEATEK